MAKVTEVVLKRGDPRLERILIGPVPPSMLALIRSQRKERDETKDKDGAPAPSAGPDPDPDPEEI